MYVMDQVEQFASEQIESIIKSGNVSPSCVEMLGELVDIVKDVSEYRKNNSTTYAMDSYAPEKTVEMTRRYADSMPHDTYGRSMPYNNMNYGNMNYGNMNTTGMYGSKAELLDLMKQQLSSAKSDSERQTIQECIDKLSSMN